MAITPAGRSFSIVFREISIKNRGKSEVRPNYSIASFNHSTGERLMNVKKLLSSSVLNCRKTPE
jgi:hypothetical protein